MGLTRVQSGVAGQHRSDEVHKPLLSRAVDSAPAAFVLVDEEGAVVAANQFACSMLGYERGELLTRTVHDLALSAEIASLLRPGTEAATLSGIAPLRCADHSVVLVRYQVQTTETGAGRLAVCVAYPRRVLPAGTTAHEPSANGRRRHDNRELSERESDILQLMAEGLDNDEISKHLFISRETVKSYVRRLLHKLGARSRTHAVAIALRRHLID